MNRTLRGQLITAGVFAVSLGVGLLLGSGGSEQPSEGQTTEGGDPRKLSAISDGVDRYGSTVVAQAAKLEPRDPDWRLLLRELPLEDFPNMAAMMVGRYESGKERLRFNAHFGDLLEIWGERDPSAALAWYENGMPAEMNKEVRKKLFLGWGRSDARAALTYIENGVSDGWKRSFLSNVYSGVGQSDPELAIRLLTEIPEQGYERTEMWSYACFSMGKYHPDACFEFLSSLPHLDEDRNRGFDQMFSAIADGETALRLWQSIDEGDFRCYLNGPNDRINQDRIARLEPEELIRIWTTEFENDSHGAERYASQLSKMRTEDLLELAVSSPGVIPNQLHRFIAAELTTGFGVDQRSIRAIYGEVLAVDGADKFIGNYMYSLGQGSQWGEVGLEVIADLDGDLRAQASAAFARGLVGYSHRFPQAALQWVGHLEDQASQTAAQAEIARSWAARSSAPAVEWAVSGEVMGDRTPVIKAVFSDWADSDTSSASEWVGALPADDPDRDGLIGALVRSMIREEEFSGALDWFDQISDAESDAWREILDIDELEQRFVEP